MLQANNVERHPTIEQWEEFAKQNSVSLTGLPYQFEKPKSPPKAEGAVAPEARRWDSFTDLELHLENLSKHIQCKPPTQTQKRVDYGTLVKVLAHTNLFVLFANIRWTVKKEHLKGAKGEWALFAEVPSVLAIERGHGSVYCTQR